MGVRHEMTVAGLAVGAAVASGRAQLLRDAGFVALATVLVFALAGHLEMAERYLEWASGHEHWQADEVPFTLLALCAGLAWFAWRRSREAMAMRGRVQALTRHLLAVQEEERRRLARDLHDEMGQRCAAIRFEAQCVLQGLAALEGGTDAGGDPAGRLRGRSGDLPTVLGGLAASARAIGDSAAALHRELRRVLTCLRPAALDSLGLEAALGDLVGDWQRTYRIPVACRIGPLGSLPDGLAIGAFRLVQEALTNTARHACAHAVTLHVSRDGEALTIVVADDGQGFSAGRPADRGGYGLAGMRERVAGLGGALSITGAPGAGVRIAARIPVGPIVEGGEGGAS